MAGWTEFFGSTSDDMARKSAKSPQKINEARITQYEMRLSELQTEREAFETVFAELGTDRSMSVADTIELAQRYRGGGSKPSSKKAALEIISKRFLELVRSSNQIKQASKARPW